MLGESLGSGEGVHERGQGLPQPQLLTGFLALVSPHPTPFWASFPHPVLSWAWRQNKQGREEAQSTVRLSPLTELSDSCLQSQPLVQGLQEVPIL